MFYQKLTMGDTMVLVYIEDRILAGTIITYLEQMKIKYTTSFSQEIKYAIVAEINKKTIEIMNQTKTIFIAYLEENKIQEKFVKENKINRQYKNKIISILNQCTKVVVSMPYFKKIIPLKTDIVVIPKEVVKLDFVKTKKGKSILFCDNDYNNLEMMYEIANQYSKYKFFYIGYKNKLSLKEKAILNKMPNNVIFVKNFSILTYIELVKDCYLVINNNIDLMYSFVSIMLKKHLILKDNPYYEDYFIPSKDCYFYDDLKTLCLKMNKIIDRRVSNLSEDAYDKFAKINCKYVAIKYSILLI